MLVIISLDYVSSAEIPDEFDDQIIIESVSHRKGKIISMVADLLKTVVIENPEARLGLIVTDESGKPVKLNGSVLTSDLDKQLSLKVSPDSVVLSSVSTSGTALELGKSEPKVDVAFIENAGPKYNQCSRQNEFMSPRQVF
ncbi:unnamed protein product [Caenorhabditis bovis]|uniref:Uncharacterized protein n=1 Tax=Caenorhabditis bovis TaxID=2654633 RepID=A0A8S1EVN4_9PELO|nr:unnamed protein product [Caenorhabditis bovis]